MRTSIITGRRRMSLIVTALACGLSLAGCTTAETRPAAVRPTTQAAPAEDREAAAGVMADDDTETAKRAAIENRDDQKTEKPVAPKTRSGTGVVDQPRVGGRP